MLTSTQTSTGSKIAVFIVLSAAVADTTTYTQHYCLCDGLAKFAHGNITSSMSVDSKGSHWRALSLAFLMIVVTLAGGSSQLIACRIHCSLVCTMSCISTEQSAYEGAGCQLKVWGVLCSWCRCLQHFWSSDCSKSCSVYGPG